MSNNNPLLKTLVPPSEPPAINMMPQTIGWKITALIVFVLLVWWGIHTYKSWKSNQYRRDAVNSIETLVSRRTTSNRHLQQLNKIAKQCAIISYGSHRVASAQGDDWYNILNQGVRTPLPKTLFLQWQDALYRPQSAMNVGDQATLTEWVTGWCNTHKVTVSREK